MSEVMNVGVMNVGQSYLPVTSESELHISRISTAYLQEILVRQPGSVASLVFLLLQYVGEELHHVAHPKVQAEHVQAPPLLLPPFTDHNIFLGFQFRLAKRTSQAVLVTTW